MSEIVLAAAHGRALHGLDAAFAPGLHLVVGAPADGSAELVELLAGVCAPRRGSVRVDGADVYRDPASRRRIGALLAVERLPGGDTVKRVVARVLALRGAAGGSATHVLEACGLAAWSSRRTGTLSPLERRAIALALALSVEDPRLLALFEPLAAGVERARVLASIREHVTRGACVVCVTGSARDAAEMSGTVWLLERGTFTRRPQPPLARDLAPGIVPDLIVRTSDPRRLGARIAIDAAISGVDWDERVAPNELRVRGVDPDAVALAVMRAAHEGDIHIDAITQTLPALELVQAATAGLARGAYDAAYRAYVGAARPRPVTPAPVFGAPAPAEPEGSEQP